MKIIICWIVLNLAVGLHGQDSTVFYTHWDRVSSGELLSADSLEGTAHTAVQYRDHLPLRIQHYDNSGNLVAHRLNSYDSLGNHLSRTDFYPNGKPMEEWVFQNNLSELNLFRQIYENSFLPTNRNYSVQRTFNEGGRETGYYIRSVDGKSICHQTTDYNSEDRKTHEILVDDLKGITILERKYRYKDDRIILEEYDGGGKMVQRVVLFDENVPVLPGQP